MPSVAPTFPPPGAPAPMMAPVAPPAPRGLSPLASTGIRMMLVAAALLLAVAIAASTLPGSVIAARLTAFPKPSVSIESSAQGNVGTGEGVTLTAQRTSGNQLTYAWSFTNGDGSPIQDSSGHDISAIGPSTTQSFDNYGDVTVTLTATDPTGQSAQATTTVRVLPPPPTASFTYTQSSSYFSNCAYDFDASGSNSQAGIQDYTWNFGDNSSPDDRGSYAYDSYDYSYSGSGQYTVTLTVTDPYGQTASTQQTISASC